MKTLLNYYDMNNSLSLAGKGHTPWSQISITSLRLLIIYLLNRRATENRIA